MQRLNRIILVIFLITFSTRLSVGQEFNEVGYAQDTVITKQSNVREFPSTKYSILAVLNPNDEVRIIDQTQINGYLRVLFGNSQQGFVYYKNVKTQREVINAFNLDPTLTIEKSSKESCVLALSDCPARGCYPSNSPGALFNEAKRHNPTDRIATFLTFIDFKRMQDVVDRRLRRSQNVQFTREQRQNLKNIKLFNRTVGEGSLITLVGNIPIERGGKTGLKTGSIETVNCRLTKTIDKDIHIPFTPQPFDTEFEGIVIEMIPQKRPSEWNLRKLRLVQRRKRLVMISGGLFYDNEHVVNTKPNLPLRGHSKRFSLWEIHPVTRFLVCAKPDNSCNPTRTNDWVKLEDYQ